MKNNFLFEKLDSNSMKNLIDGGDSGTLFPPITLSCLTVIWDEKTQTQTVKEDPNEPGDDVN